MMTPLLRGLRVVNRTIGGVLPARLLSRRVAGIPGRIHVDDQMLRSDAPEHVRHYVDDAASAIDNLAASLAVVAREFSDVRACLDFASGYGRVTRLLCERISPARITASDVDRRAVRFVAAELGVRGLVAAPDPRRLELAERYDLIFCGSLLTHLRIDVGLSVLDALVRATQSGGLVVFSTQGESCLAHLDWYGAEFVAAEQWMRDRVAGGGAFVAYRGHRDYGITIHARAHLEHELAERFRGRAAVVRFAERGWDRHQDVWTLRRT